MAEFAIAEKKNQSPFIKFITNQRVLNVLSILIFLGVWDLLCITGISTQMPRPHEVFYEFFDLFVTPLAGKTMGQHILISRYPYRGAYGL